MTHPPYITSIPKSKTTLSIHLIFHFLTKTEKQTPEVSERLCDKSYILCVADKKENDGRRSYFISEPLPGSPCWTRAHTMGTPRANTSQKQQHAHTRYTYVHESRKKNHKPSFLLNVTCNNATMFRPPRNYIPFSVLPLSISISVIVAAMRRPL